MLIKDSPWPVWGCASRSPAGKQWGQRNYTLRSGCFLGTGHSPGSPVRRVGGGQPRSQSLQLRFLGSGVDLTQIWLQTGQINWMLMMHIWSHDFPPSSVTLVLGENGRPGDNTEDAAGRPDCSSSQDPFCHAQRPWGPRPGLDLCLHVPLLLS